MATDTETNQFDQLQDRLVEIYRNVFPDPLAERTVVVVPSLSMDQHELEKVDGAHWDKEMGAVVEVLYRERVEKSKAVLFDNIPGYPQGYRCLYGMLASPYRLALAVGMDTDMVDDRFAMLNASGLASSRASIIR